MTLYSVWYMKPEFFSKGIAGVVPAADLSSHTKVKDLEVAKAAKDFALDYVFHHMQGEVWSPNGEAMPMIRGLGLEHTSMSVGDVIEQDGKFWMVDHIGFRELDHIRSQ